MTKVEIEHIFEGIGRAPLAFDVPQKERFMLEHFSHDQSGEVGLQRHIFWLIKQLGFRGKTGIIRVIRRAKTIFGELYDLGNHLFNKSVIQRIHFHEEFASAIKNYLHH